MLATSAGHRTRRTTAPVTVSVTVRVTAGPAHARTRTREAHRRPQRPQRPLAERPPAPPPPPPQPPLASPAPLEPLAPALAVALLSVAVAVAAPLDGRARRVGRLCARRPIGGDECSGGGRWRRRSAAPTWTRASARRSQKEGAARGAVAERATQVGPSGARGHRSRRPLGRQLLRRRRGRPEGAGGRSGPHRRVSDLMLTRHYHSSLVLYSACVYSVQFCMFSTVCSEVDGSVPRRGFRRRAPPQPQKEENTRQKPIDWKDPRVCAATRQCYGPNCLYRARPGSKYCSDACGIRLAEARIRRFLPDKFKASKILYTVYCVL